jgi:hypothetical protein
MSFEELLDDEPLGRQFPSHPSLYGPPTITCVAGLNSLAGMQYGSLIFGVPLGWGYLGMEKIFFHT